ncbi:MAG: signal recognition particle-docking protein FtsY [Nanoarchaeota archaeon]|nr:signal recognition particle-docking protein FtsY [Nanoarchaeota archaeon]
MFKSLREKLSSWLGKSEKEKPEKKKPSEKPKKEKKKILIEPEKKSLFAKLSIKLKTITLTQEHIDLIFEDLEIILLENNVALEVVDKIRQDLTKDLVGIETKKGDIEQTITNSLKESISNVLIEPPDLIKQIKNSSKNPFTIIFFGINGSGKTTSMAKLAYKLKQEKISCVLAASDTFRAASIEQLEKHATNLKIKVIKHQYGSDPAAVAFDAKKYAEKNHIKCVLIDTAGRMYTKENLLKQMEKIIRVSKPDLKIFVGESITGNDATEQARTFDKAVGIDGIILSKADVDEKGGTALSVSYITQKPIFFLGTGQGMNDLKDFKKAEVLKNLGLS